MKKTIITLFALLALLACNKEADTQEPSMDNTPVSFNLKVDRMDSKATKATLKADWADGDVVYVFFDAIPGKYIKKSFDGTDWSDSYPGGEFVSGDFSESGPAASPKMTAVWFPQGEVTVTYADSKFSFTINDEKIYSHYMSVYTDYTVDGTTVSGELQMEKPAGFVQFFVPGIDPDDIPTYRFMESHFTPKACDYVALAGDVSESALTAGYSVKGMAFTTDNSVSGVLFGGYLASAGEATDYTFSLVKELSVEKPAAVGTYTLSGTRTIAEGTSMSFPATSSWTYGQYVDLGIGTKWATGNVSGNTQGNGTIVSPLEAGDYYSWMRTSFDQSEEGGTDTAAWLLGGSWRMPTRDDVTKLIGIISDPYYTWKTGWTNIGYNNAGALITSKNNGLSLFLAAAGSYQLESGMITYKANQGCFWTSFQTTVAGYTLIIHENGLGGNLRDCNDGHSVRPVMD